MDVVSCTPSDVGLVQSLLQMQHFLGNTPLICPVGGYLWQQYHRHWELQTRMNLKKSCHNRQVSLESGRKAQREWLPHHKLAHLLSPIGLLLHTRCWSPLCNLLDLLEPNTYSQILSTCSWYSVWSVYMPYFWPFCHQLIAVVVADKFETFSFHMLLKWQNLLQVVLWQLSFLFHSNNTQKRCNLLEAIQGSVDDWGGLDAGCSCHSMLACNFAQNLCWAKEDNLEISWFCTCERVVSFEFHVHGGLGVGLRLSILCCFCSQAIEDLIIHKHTK